MEGAGIEPMTFQSRANYANQGSPRGKIASSGLNFSKRELVVLMLKSIFCFTPSNQFSTEKNG